MMLTAPIPPQPAVMGILFLIFFYLPLIIFQGFFIIGKKKPASFWQWLEASIVVLATGFIVVLQRTFFIAQALSVEVFYFFLVVSAILGLLLFYMEIIKERASRWPYVILLASIIGAADVDLVILIKESPMFWLWLLLFIFILPSLVVLIWQLSGRGAQPRATFLIWSGLGGLITIITLPFTIGFYYLPIYFLLAVTALIIEFLPRNPIDPSVSKKEGASAR